MSAGGVLGMGKSNSSNQSTSESQGTSQSQGASMQSVFDSGIYQKLYGGAFSAAQSGLADSATLGASARDLFTGGTNFLDSLSKPNSGENYEASRLNGSNPALDEQINQLGLDENKFLTNTALPGIVTNSVGSGTLGNDRQGVAQGTAIAAANKDFLTQAATLRANDVNQRDAVAANLAGQTLQGASTGLGALPSMMDLLTKSSAPQLGIYQQLASVLGGPTTLTQQFSRSYAQNTSSGNSSGRANAWNFNMGAQAGL